MRNPSIFSIFLKALRVPFTQEYSDKRFYEMPFKSLFGFNRLLKDYGIPSEGLAFDDKNELVNLPVPSLLQVKGKPVVLTGIQEDYALYQDTDTNSRIPLKDFINDWSGMALVAYPETDSTEPEYSKHHFHTITNIIKNRLLILATALIVLYAFITNGLYHHVSTIILTGLNIIGIYISSLLILKTAHIDTSTGDRVCGVIQKGGCDAVLETKGSDFFGIFHWSEVGFAYFSVTTFTLLVFPHYINYLAFINLFCLPYSFWSVWYQKTRAKRWCTMCLIVQALLWCSFFCYLGGNLYHNIFPLRWPFFIICAAYVAVLFAINKLTPLMDKRKESI